MIPTTDKDLELVFNVIATACPVGQHFCTSTRAAYLGCGCLRTAERVLKAQQAAREQAAALRRLVEIGA